MKDLIHKTLLELDNVINPVVQLFTLLFLYFLNFVLLESKIVEFEILKSIFE